MLEFKELKPEEYGSFYAKSPQRTFLNSLEAMEHLKVRNRDIIYFGVKKDGELYKKLADHARGRGAEVAGSSLSANKKKRLKWFCRFPEKYVDLYLRLGR